VKHALGLGPGVDGGSRQENVSKQGGGELAGNIRARTPFSCMGINRTLFLSCILMAASGEAHAQAPPGPVTPPAQTAPPSPSRATNCAPMRQGEQPGAPVREGTTTGQRAEPLGDKLARSEGVLCPPAGIDPEMHAPAPDVGNTPVIPPPGSPGGDPAIRPK
jgi:hypothetical protein